MGALTPAAAAELCARLYDPGVAGWDYQTRANAAVYLALAGDTVVCRGSDDAIDWLHDGLAEFWRPLASHPALGDLPLGFASGLDASYAALRARLAGAQPRLVGHSLGAAHAAALAALFTLDGQVPAQVILFGCPRPGMRALARAVVPIADWRSYRNTGHGGHDLVTDLPTDPPYDHPRPLIDVSAPPAPGDRWGPFAYHHIALYQQAVTELEIAA